MRSGDIENEVPRVGASQWKLDRTLKYLRKPRWIGKEPHVQAIHSAPDYPLRQAESPDLSAQPTLAARFLSRQGLPLAPSR